MTQACDSLCAVLTSKPFDSPQSPSDDDLETRLCQAQLGGQCQCQPDKECGLCKKAQDIYLMGNTVGITQQTPSGPLHSKRIPDAANNMMIRNYPDHFVIEINTASGNSILKKKNRTHPFTKRTELLQERNIEARSPQNILLKRLILINSQWIIQSFHFACKHVAHLNALLSKNRWKIILLTGSHCGLLKLQRAD